MFSLQGLAWGCSGAEVAPVPGARGLQRGPEGVGLAGRVAKADERQEEHDAGQHRQGRSAAAGRAEAELLQRYRQRQGDTCAQPCASGQSLLLTHAATLLIIQALHVAGRAVFLMSDRAPLSQPRRSTCLGGPPWHGGRAPIQRCTEVSSCQASALWQVIDSPQHAAAHLAERSMICCCAPSCKLSARRRS